MAPTLRSSDNKMLYVRHAAGVVITSTPISADTNWAMKGTGNNRCCEPHPNSRTWRDRSFRKRMWLSDSASGDSGGHFVHVLSGVTRTLFSWRMSFICTNPSPYAAIRLCPIVFLTLNSMLMCTHEYFHSRLLQLRREFGQMSKWGAVCV